MDNLKCNKTLFGAVTYNHLCAGNEEKNQCSVSSILYFTYTYYNISYLFKKLKKSPTREEFPL